MRVGVSLVSVRTQERVCLEQQGHAHLGIVSLSRTIIDGYISQAGCAGQSFPLPRQRIPVLLLLLIRCTVLWPRGSI